MAAIEKVVFTEDQLFDGFQLLVKNPAAFPSAREGVIARASGRQSAGDLAAAVWGSDGDTQWVYMPWKKTRNI